MLRHYTHISFGATRQAVKLRETDPILAPKQPAKLCIAPDFVEK